MPQLSANPYENIGTEVDDISGDGTLALNVYELSRNCLYEEGWCIMDDVHDKPQFSLYNEWLFVNPLGNSCPTNIYTIHCQSIRAQP